MDIIITIALVVIAVCMIFVTFILWSNIDALNALYCIERHTIGIEVELEELNSIYERMYIVGEDS